MARKHQVGIEIKTTADPKGAKRTEDALEEVENQARKVRQALDNVDGIDPSVRKQIEGVANSLDRAAVSGRKMASAQGQNAKANKNSGLAVLEFSRAIEDAQYGIRGVLNNIPSLISFLGGSAGLAGVISLAAVGLTQLVSHLMDTGEAAEESAKFLEEVTNQVEDYYAEAARDGNATFRKSMERATELLSRQNIFLEKNLKLLQQKRAAELRVASAGQDLELAQIAQGEATGQLSAEQAEAARRAIEIQRLRTASEEKILQANEEVELLSRQRADAIERQTRTAEKLAKAEDEMVHLVERRNTLRRLEAKLEDSGVQMPPNMRADLVKIQESLIPDLQDAINGMKAAIRSTEKQKEALAVAEAEARKTAIVVQETETQILDLTIRTKETQAQTAAQNEAIKEANSLLLDIAKDGVLDSKERQEATNLLQQFNRDSALANSATAEVLRAMLREVQITVQEMNAFRETIKRLEASRGR